MSVVLTILHVTVCFTLILVILLQAGKGQGLTGGSFGTGNVQSLLGTRAGDFLSKATTVAAIGFLLTSISLDYIEAQKSRSLLKGPPSSTLDVEQIKKALEQVKGEAEKAQSESAETATSATVEKAQPAPETQSK